MATDPTVLLMPAARTEWRAPDKSFLGDRRHGGRHLRVGLLSAPTTLDQQGEEENHVDREDREKNVPEPLATIILFWVAARGTRGLKRIGRIHSCFFSQ